MYLSTKAFLLFLSIVPMAFAATKSDSAEGAEILALEKAAMERWCKGNVEGYLANSAHEVTYFDPFTARRLNNISELTTLYHSFAGQFHFDRFEMIDPKIQISENVAVLTYNLVTYLGSKENRWNATVVYQKTRKEWKIMHTHMSLTQPKFAKNPGD